MISYQFLDINNAQLQNAIMLIDGLNGKGRFEEDSSPETLKIFFKGLARGDIQTAELYFLKELNDFEKLVAQALYLELLH